MRTGVKLLFPVVAAAAAVTFAGLPAGGPVTPAPAVTPVAAPAVTYGGAVSEFRQDGTERLHTVTPAGEIVVIDGNKSYVHLAPKSGKQNAARWNRCEPIHYLVNPKGMPKAALDVIPAALKKVSKATGIRFVKAETTNVIPFQSDKWADRFSGEKRNVLVIASATAKQVPAFGTGTIGYGGPLWRIVGNGDPEIILGGVTVSRAAKLQPGFVGENGAPTWGQLFLHELGHSMNLGHVDDDKQVMYPTLTVNSPADYADGDVAGLAALRALPCFTD